MLISTPRFYGEEGIMEKKEVEANLRFLQNFSGLLIFIFVLGFLGCLIFTIRSIGASGPELASVLYTITVSVLCIVVVFGIYRTVRVVQWIVKKVSALDDQLTKIE
jgi:hypothetical protein